MKSNGARLEQLSFAEAKRLRRQHVKLKSSGGMSQDSNQDSD